jgi:class 3 adenylate cyclase
MMRLGNLPRHRAIVAVDIEGSTSRTDTAKARLRDLMYEMFEQALDGAGITRRYRDPLIDRGDGVLALIRPVDQAPKTLLLNSVMPMLSALLRQHDAQRPSQYLRLRAVVHAGEVRYDARGCFGEALDISFRLLDAPVVKRELRQIVSPLVLVVSDDIYRSVVRHGYDGIDDKAYLSRVHVHVAGRHHQGWIKLAD